MAAKVMAGVSLKDQGITEELWPTHTSVKESVFPFARFLGVDIILGPEMRSTGEVMGIDDDFAAAFAKSQQAAGVNLPTEGTVYITMAHDHKQKMVEPARRLQSLGFKLAATAGTAEVFRAAGLEVEIIKKLQEGRPNLLDLMTNGEIQFIFNTPSGKGSRTDEGKIRAAAVSNGVPCVTTPGRGAMRWCTPSSIWQNIPTLRFGRCRTGPTLQQRPDDRSPVSDRSGRNRDMKIGESSVTSCTDRACFTDCSHGCFKLVDGSGNLELMPGDRLSLASP